MQITAVVVTHSRPDLLSKVIESLQRQTRPVNRIVIVDNASNMATRALLDSVAGITVLRSEINLGGAGGFTLGMKQACALGTDWIWLLDDDAIPRTDALGALVDALPHLPGKLGAVCGTVYEYGDIAIMHRRRFGRWLGVERCVDRQAYANRFVPLDTASFVGFMVSVSAAAAVGLPNPEFFLAYDDTEYSLRLRAAGFKLWLVPSSIVDHQRSAESRLRSTEFGRKHYFNVRNRIIVKKSYAQFCHFSAWTGIFFGFALWMRCKGRFRRKTFRVLLRAIADGYYGQLGPYPQTLEVP